MRFLGKTFSFHLHTEFYWFVKHSTIKRSQDRVTHFVTYTLRIIEKINFFNSRSFTDILLGVEYVT